jgi:hypothetical protein
MSPTAGGGPSLVTNYAECLRESEKAILVDITGEMDGSGQKWVPKSCIHSTSVVQRGGDCGALIVFAWFGNKLEVALK